MQTQNTKCAFHCLRGKSQCLKYWLDERWRVHVDSIKSHLVLGESAMLTSSRLPKPINSHHMLIKEKWNCYFWLPVRVFDVKSLQDLGWKAQHIQTSAPLFIPVLCFLQKMCFFPAPILYTRQIGRKWQQTNKTQLSPAANQNPTTLRIVFCTKQQWHCCFFVSLSQPGLQSANERVARRDWIQNHVC